MQNPDDGPSKNHKVQLGLNKYSLLSLNENSTAYLFLTKPNI
jgi:hypothetical protein